MISERVRARGDPFSRLTVLRRHGASFSIPARARIVDDPTIYGMTIEAVRLHVARIRISCSARAELMTIHISGVMRWRGGPGALMVGKGSLRQDVTGRRHHHSITGRNQEEEGEEREERTAQTPRSQQHHRLKHGGSVTRVSPNVPVAPSINVHERSKAQQ